MAAVTRLNSHRSLHTWLLCDIASHGFTDSRTRWRGPSFWCWALRIDRHYTTPLAPQDGTHGLSELALASGIDEGITNRAREGEVVGNHVKTLIEVVFAEETTSYPADPEGQEQQQKRSDDDEHVHGGTVLFEEFRPASDRGLGGDARGFDTFLSGRLEDRIVEDHDHEKRHEEQSENVNGLHGIICGSAACPGLFTDECLAVVGEFTMAEQGLNGHDGGRQDPQVEHRLDQVAPCEVRVVQQGLLHYGSVPGLWDMKGSTIKQLPSSENEAGDSPRTVPDLQTLKRRVRKYTRWLGAPIGFAGPGIWLVLRCGILEIEEKSRSELRDLNCRWGAMLNHFCQRDMEIQLSGVEARDGSI